MALSYFVYISHPFLETGIKKLVAIKNGSPPGMGSLKCSLNHFISKDKVSKVWRRNLKPSGRTVTYSCRACVRGMYVSMNLPG